MDYLENFQEYLIAELGAQDNTVLAYVRDVKDFLKRTNKKIENINSKDLQKYFSISRELTARSIARKLSSIKKFFYFLSSENIIEANPTQNIDAPKIGKSIPKYLNFSEIKKIILKISSKSSPHALRAYALIELLYASGFRVSELVSLPLSAYKKDKNIIYVLGKGSKERAVPINKDAILACEKYLKIRDFFIKKGEKNLFLFPSIGKTHHLTRDGFFKYLKKISLEAGVNPIKVSPHVFRHSFASHLLQAGMDLRTLQQILGHEDITTTQVYTHVMENKLKELVNSHHPLGDS